MLGGQYLVATADSPATPAEVRMAAPEGEWYVYLSWVRHPHSAKDAVVHVGGSTIKVDQSRLASGSLYRQRPRHASLLLPHLGSRGMPLTVVLGAYLVDVTSNRLRLREADNHLLASPQAPPLRRRAEPGEPTPAVRRPIRPNTKRSPRTARF